MRAVSAAPHYGELGIQRKLEDIAIVCIEKTRAPGDRL